MKSYGQQIADTIPEFFFIWHIADHRITYVTDDDLRFEKKMSRDDYFSLIRNMINHDQRETFDKMFSQIDIGFFYQDIDFKTTGLKRQKYINIRTYPISDNGKVMKVAGHVLDITHKIEHEISLKEKNQKFEDIIHILAHELRGPLGNIMNFAELQQTTDDPNELQSYALIIKRISRESNGLISSMIELVELESEKFRLDMEECDLKIFLEMAVSQFVNQAKEKNISITTGFADEVKLPLDRIKFKLVVHNLLSNAIKFTEERGSIEISIKKEDGAVNISFKDTGIGIPPEKQKCLFEKFSGARRKGLRGEKSTGLGLSIAKKIINLHEGRIDVYSEVGRGSTFTIRLPLKINGQRTGDGSDFISPENINEKMT